MVFFSPFLTSFLDDSKSKKHHFFSHLNAVHNKAGTVWPNSIEVLPVPLSNAGSAGIGQNHTPYITQDLGLRDETTFLVRIGLSASHCNYYLSLLFFS